MVDTPMTAKMVMPAILVAKPEKIAKDIVRAIQKKKSIVYSPWFWKYIMLGIIHVPDTIYKKIKL